MVTDSARCMSMEGAFFLWSFYMTVARSHTLCLGDRVRHVKYEDFLANPGEQLGELTAFCGLNSNDEKMSGIISEINPDRAFAYQRDEKLAAFAASKIDDLKPYGYSA